MASSSRIEIERFNGQNYEPWKLKMEYLLVDQEQWTAVCQGTHPIAMSTKEWEKLERNERSTIWLCLTDSMLLNVSGEDPANKLWDKMGILYQSKSLLNKLFFIKKLFLLRMSDGNSMNEHLNAFNTMLIQLSSMDINMMMRRSVSSYYVLCQTPGTS
jgi:hypothetical protein